jgi:hypothetical protein
MVQNANPMNMIPQQNKMPTQSHQTQNNGGISGVQSQLLMQKLNKLSEQ